MKDSNYLRTHRFQPAFVLWQGFVIAFVSEFVLRLCYTLGEGHDSLEGLVNSTLTCFVATDFPEDERPSGSDADELFRSSSCGLGLPTWRWNIPRRFNPLKPGAFCQKGVSWTFWCFFGPISVKLPLIRSKMPLHHNSLAFLPLASRCTTFSLGHAQKSKF